jgi:hypothetical protein
VEKKIPLPVKNGRINSTNPVYVGNTIPDPGVPDIPEYGITKQ